MGLAVNPRRGEVIINKSTMSAFIGTNFELLLRNSNRTTVIITGIATEMGVESTARDALNRGFIPVVVTDAVSSSDKESHERSLANMSKIAITLTSEELRKTWIQKNESLAPSRAERKSEVDLSPEVIPSLSHYF